MSARARAAGACRIAPWIVLAAVLVAPSPAHAEGCPNERFRSGPSERLPDCRAYEQVSPVEKGGLDAVTLAPMQPAQSSPCEPGEACTIAYMNVGASFAGAPGNEIANAYLGSRGAGGWQTTALTPPTPQAPPSSVAHVTYAFSSNLSQVVLRVPLQQLTEGAPAGVYNLYLREPGGGYALITASPPPEPPASGCGRCFEAEDVPAFAGASSDFSHVLFEANDGLEGAPSGEFEGRHIENLYEAFGGHVHPVGELPDGKIASHGASAGGGISVAGKQVGELEHAISADGSRVVFTAEADGGTTAEEGQTGKPELYDRLDGTKTIELSAPEPGARADECETAGGECDPEPAKFWAASADGSVVYFTSKAALTPDSFTGPEESPQARREWEEETGEPVENPGDDLYRYDVDTRTLTDLTALAGSEANPDGADVLGVVGASEDGSYVYFVATGELPTGELATGQLAAGPRPGAPNLYVWHETGEGAGAVRFIATLAPPSESEQVNIEHERLGSAFPYQSDVLDWSGDPLASQAYVTPDGRHLAFMSVEPLTNYDNRQTVVEDGHRTEVADHEVFEYSAEGGHLTCASCDPDDAPPLGSAFIGASLTERASTPFHQPRTLSDDGSRLFFTSPDSLVPGMAGGTDKLFEYEDGAVHLISGAEGGTTATFLDASASGADVFFATRERLAPSDADEQLDVYDARVDGGLPAPAPAGPAPCQLGACRTASEPPPPLAAPLSASFDGAGDLAPAPAAKPSRKQLLAQALAKCRRLKGAKKRQACVQAANRRYAPKAGRARRASARRAAGR